MAMKIDLRKVAERANVLPGGPVMRALEEYQRQIEGFDRITNTDEAKREALLRLQRAQAEPKAPAMSGRALRALKESITVWERRAKGQIVPPTREHCALCTQFWRTLDGRAACFGCPIYEHTKIHGCEGTPYRPFFDHLDVCRTGPYCPECLRLIQAEVDFLKSLLPVEYCDCEGRKRLERLGVMCDNKLARLSGVIGQAFEETTNQCPLCHKPLPRCH